jgi:hypothetical protein
MLVLEMPTSSTSSYLKLEALGQSPTLDGPTMKAYLVLSYASWVLSQVSLCQSQASNLKPNVTPNAHIRY